MREFRDFLFAGNSDEYKSKVAFVETNLGWGDLVTACNILAIDYPETKKELSQRICNLLIDLDSLNNASESGEGEDAGQ